MFSLGMISAILTRSVKVQCCQLNYSSSELVEGEATHWRVAPSGMSVDDEAELCALLTEALERNGVLAGIRAQLRAGVFLALERERETRIPTAPLQRLLETKTGRLSLLLVRELFEWLEFRHSTTVYTAEAGAGLGYSGRSDLTIELVSALPGLHLDPQPSMPLLASILTAIETIKTSPDTPQSVASPRYDSSFISEQSNNVSVDANQSEPVQQSDQTQSSDLSTNKEVSEVPSQILNNSSNGSIAEDIPDPSVPETNRTQSENSDSTNNNITDESSHDSNHSIHTCNSKFCENTKLNRQNTSKSDTHTPDPSSQYSKRSDIFDESVIEELLLYDKTNMETNIISKLTASSENSYATSISEIVPIIEKLNPTSDDDPSPAQSVETATNNNITDETTPTEITDKKSSTDNSQSERLKRKLVDRIPRSKIDGKPPQLSPVHQKHTVIDKNGTKPIAIAKKNIIIKKDVKNIKPPDTKLSASAAKKTVSAQADILKNKSTKSRTDLKKDEARIELKKPTVNKS